MNQTILSIHELLDAAGIPRTALVSERIALALSDRAAVQSLQMPGIRKTGLI